MDVGSLEITSSYNESKCRTEYIASKEVNGKMRYFALYITDKFLEGVGEAQASTLMKESFLRAFKDILPPEEE